MMHITNTLIPALFILLVACNSPQTNREKTSTVSVGDTLTTVASPVVSLEECYRSKTGNSVVEMTVKVTNGLVDGTLDYLPEAKDKNTGSIKGRMIGDTLLADYSFMSEGVESVREVIFLKTVAGYKEGYGPVKNQNGKMVFEDPKKADFSKSTPLLKVECNKGKL